jgi:hypothetical protein
VLEQEVTKVTEDSEGNTVGFVYPRLQRHWYRVGTGGNEGNGEFGGGTQSDSFNLDCSDIGIVLEQEVTKVTENLEGQHSRMRLTPRTATEVA